MNSVAAGPTASGSRVGRPAILDGRGLRPQRPGSRADEGCAPSIGAREGVPSDWSSRTGKSRVAGCLDTIGELISRMNEEDLSGLSGDELLADAEALAKLVSRLGAVRGRMLLAIDKKEELALLGDSDADAVEREGLRPVSSRGFARDQAGPSPRIRLAEAVGGFDGRRDLPGTRRRRSPSVFHPRPERETG